ncbi:hypothetical protein D6D23_09679 [Aureobasidium pullulans]|uniref:BTB domain transcription factor n=1 Tax=Aureobasidium pullulans TaxID=5580 RepID=A0A4V6TFU9_AURPU|nr:hypothetical protein D6D25_07464 [Aureobasidium pullulans]THW13679.1 hypothetical protein D6D23_09679 [Aureobasidium pullulans]THW92032.1 hypothetical protein D6D15_03473 [Aureobasidium pullulans]THY60803.1 hypothetical protein D6C97_03656 [Aureobasidium pullulans]THY77725.1 hypothetical protein D6C94_01967 [Aureobasidium pullulans]
MPGTRSSARLAEKQSSPPAASQETKDNKRKADDSQSSPSKKGRKNTAEQKTLEETFKPTEDNDASESKPSETEQKPAADSNEQKPAEQASESEQKSSEQTNDSDMKDDNSIKQVGESYQGKNKEGESKEDPEKALKDSRGGAGLNTLEPENPKPKPENLPIDDIHRDFAADPNVKSTQEPEGHESKTDGSEQSKNGAVEESKDRAEQMPSNILEKGIIYFFTRGRVGIDDPQSVQDLQRSYFVLRPLPNGAKLGDGAIEDVKNNRLFALPKKVFPRGPNDKFMVFVERAKASMDELKKDFFQSSEYETKTAGNRTTHPITPIGEGVYAITATGTRSESHLAYMLTIPQEPGQMQEDVGIRSKGSFVLSLKNPTVKGPSYATLDQPAEFPPEVIREFDSRSWMPAQPKHLDYANAQCLMIGEPLDDSHALEATSKDAKSDNTETPREEIEKLEHEDELRVEHLKGDDTVFADLGLSHKEYPSVPTTW